MSDFFDDRADGFSFDRLEEKYKKDGDRIKNLAIVEMVERGDVELFGNDFPIVGVFGPRDPVNTRHRDARLKMYTGDKFCVVVENTAKIETETRMVRGFEVTSILSINGRAWKTNKY